MKFRVRSSEFRELKSKSIPLLVRFLIAIVLLLGFLSFAFSTDKWSGVDETVVEKFAKEHGREAREPLINTDQGDLLIFLFLIAGAVGGFAAGYYWRMLVAEKAPKMKGQKQNSRG